MDKRATRLTVHGKCYPRVVETRLTLADVLRRDARTIAAFDAAQRLRSAAATARAQ